VGLPTATFLGPAILAGLFGGTSAITVAIAAVVSSLFLIAPTQVLLLELDHGASEDASKGQQTGSLRPGIGAVVGSATVRALRTPYVWSPLVGTALVLLGVQVPGVFDSMVELIGQTTSRGWRPSGLTLAAHGIALNVEVTVNTLLKMFVQPALMVALVLMLGIADPTAREGIVICALPSPVMPTILSTRYRVYESEASSTLVFTSALMIATIPIVVFLTDN
jgi:predicted permease